LIVRRRK